MCNQDIFVSEKNLYSMVRDIFIGTGLSEKDAIVISKHLVNADMRGVKSHGVSRVNIYYQRLEKNIIEKNMSSNIEKETKSTALINGNNRFGILNANDAIKIAVNKAEETGIGMVGVKNSNHAGMLADYMDYATKKNYIAFATTNAPSSMAPWGGKEKFFGTNPLAYGIPTPINFPIIFDMATSVVARGKITYAKHNNQKIPLGWALTKDGEPTKDPYEATDGLVLPVGGPKGYGLAFLVEILSSILTGAAYGPHIGSLLKDWDRPQNVGHFFFVMRIDLFDSKDNFMKRVEEMINEIRQVPLADGYEKIYLPGELEVLEMDKRKLKGVPLTTGIIDDLNKMAKDLGINYKLKYKM